MRFNELTKSVIYCDYHIHTVQTDGHATVEEYIQAAIKKGLKEIAFTEHVRKSTGWYDSFVKEVKNLKKKYKSKLTIFYGIEAKILDYDGNIDATEDMIHKSEIVLGSVHRYPRGDGNYLNFQELSCDNAAKIEFKLACAIVKNPNVDVVAHPGGVFEKQFNTIFPRKYLEEIIIIANHYGKAIEINSSYLKDPSSLFNLCSKLNPFVSLGSDAHNTMQLGNVIKLMNRKIRKKPKVTVKGM